MCPKWFPQGAKVKEHNTAIPMAKSVRLVLQTLDGRKSPGSLFIVFFSFLVRFADPGGFGFGSGRLRSHAHELLRELSTSTAFTPSLLLWVSAMSKACCLVETTPPS